MPGFVFPTAHAGEAIHRPVGASPPGQSPTDVVAVRRRDRLTARCHMLKLSTQPRSIHRIAAALGLAATLVATSTRGGGLFGTELCVAEVSAESQVVSVIPPDAKSANDATLFPVATVPPIQAGDLVRIEPAKGADAPLPKFVLIARGAKQCARFRAQEPPAGPGPRM